MELKDKIYTLRKKYHLTYEQVAEIVGVGKSTVHKWETGIITNMRRDKIEGLARALHTTPSYLLGGDETEESQSLPDSLGFYKIACAVPVLKVGNPSFNVQQIEVLADAAVAEGAQILLTPELSLCGYTCADLFRQRTLLKACETALASLLAYTGQTELLLVVGMPVEVGYRLFNCAVAMQGGRLLGAVPKEYIANAGEFYEKRWFAGGIEAPETEIVLCGQTVPFGRLLFRLSDELTAGIEICQDMWVTVPPSSLMALNGANLILNPSASNEVVAKAEYRRQLIVGQSARCMCAYAFAGSGVTESTTDLVFSGSTVIAENGIVLAEGKRFSRQNEIVYACIDAQKLNGQRCAEVTFADNAARYRAEYRTVEASVPALSLKNYCGFVDPHPFVPSDEKRRKERCEEIFSIQAAGLAKRLEHTGLTKSVIGISGGLDSTLALLVAVRAAKLLGLPNSSVIGVTMPGFGTTDRTYQNAMALMSSLGVTVKEISIRDACVQHLTDIGHDLETHDITYENAQARERTQILMDIANQEGGILVGTGDLSEMAMGWCTYNADHMSMYGVNAGVPKTLVRYLVKFVAGESDKKTAAILNDIFDTPVSPELLPPDESGRIAQKTEDKIGPYELHDFFLYHFFRFGENREKIAFLAEQAFMGKYDGETVGKWLDVFIRRFFVSQFKRSCTPDAPKVGSVSLSPRGDWRMPSDADFAEWMK